MSAQKLFLSLFLVFHLSYGSVLIVPALGRTADFGDIYDARTNKFTRDNIFKQSLPQKYKTLIENPYTRYDFTSAKRSSEKLNAFEISGELKLQIMCGVVNIGGSAKYLTDNQYTSNHVVSTYILKSKIAKETFNWKDEELKNFMDFKNVVDEGTHVVVGIQYGGNGVVTLSQMASENTDHKNIQAKLDATVKFLTNVEISGSIGGTFNSSTKDNSDSIKIKVEADVNVEADDDLTTLTGTHEFMKKLSGRLLNYNNKKGVQISFEMIPLSVISKYYEQTSPQIILYSALSIHHYSSINNKLTKLEKLAASFNERYFELEKNRIYFNETEQEWFDETKTEFDRNVSILFEKINKDIIAFHNHSAKNDEITKADLHINPLKRHVETFREESESLIRKSTYIQYALENGTIYIDSITKLEDTKRRYDRVIFCFVSRICRCIEQWSIAFKNFVQDRRETNAVYALVNADKMFSFVDKEVFFAGHSLYPLYIYKDDKYYIYQWGDKYKILSNLEIPQQKCTEDTLGNKTCTLTRKTIFSYGTKIPTTEKVHLTFQTADANKSITTVQIWEGSYNLPYDEWKVPGMMYLPALKEKNGVETFDLSFEINANATLIAEFKSQKSNQTGKMEIDLRIY